MQKSKNSSMMPSALEAVISKLHSTAHELERLNSPLEIPKGMGTQLSRDQLLSVARWLWSVWRSREVFFQKDLITDPGWNILLSLKIAELLGTKNSVTTVCIDSGAPATTGLRWLKSMEKEGYLVRSADHLDARRFIISLSPKTSAAMDAYLSSLRMFLNTNII